MKPKNSVTNKKSFSSLVVQAACLAGLVLSAMPAALAEQRIAEGDVLIADQFNNRVIEVDPKSHAIVWQFGNGSDKPGAHSVVGVNDAVRYGRLTLISGTGIPASSPPLPGCGDPVNGCPDNRVFLVNMHGKIVWQYGEAGVGGAGFDQLNTPVQASLVNHFQRRRGLLVLIADQANQRVIVVDRQKRLLWQYGTTGIAGSGFNQLNNPNSAQLLENGNVLIADESNNRAIEVNSDNAIVHTFTAGGTLNGVAFASRLANGNTLITDSNNNRIVEVDAQDNIVWQYATNSMAGSNPNPLPTRAVELRNGDILISDQFNERVIEIDRSKTIVFQQGKLNVAGNGFSLLNGPYDAKRIGDFTGLSTPPHRGLADEADDLDD